MSVLHQIHANKKLDIESCNSFKRWKMDNLTKMLPSYKDRHRKQLVKLQRGKSIFVVIEQRGHHIKHKKEINCLIFVNTHLRI